MKFGILFSGQGAQQTNMGLDFYEHDELFREVFDQASQACGYDLVAVCRNQNGELNQTKYVQPAIVAFSLGIYQMLQRDLPALDVCGMVGLSLGEYSAIMASKMIDIPSGMSALRDRALYMQADADARPSSMAAILKPDIAVVKQVLAQINADDNCVVIANYNSPKQVVIGGDETAVTEAIAQLQSNGIKRVIPLKVSGAFHTPLFKQTSQKLEKRLAELDFSAPEVCVMSNTTATPFDRETISAVLAKQVICPTHFGKCLAELIEQTNLDCVLELGPGAVLSKFAKQIDKTKQRKNIGTYDEYRAFVLEMKG